MKTKFLSVFGAVGFASMLTLSLVVNTQSSTASSLTKMNVALLTEPPAGKCTGPKDVEKQTCKSENTNPCADTSGCK